MGGVKVKNLSLLVWVTQFGLSVTVPLCGALLIGSWLDFGPWALAACGLVGLLTSVSTACSCVKAMRKETKQDQEQPCVAFNEHE